MKLYHYTSINHLKEILRSGEIRLTASNLMKPKNPTLLNGRLVDETDNYMPVVWFTDTLDFETAYNCGLSGGIEDKTEAAITVTVNDTMTFYKWDQWAEQNDIDPEWFEALKKTAPEWDTFYISETPVKITNETGIIFRPDIAELLKQ